MSAMIVCAGDALAAEKSAPPAAAKPNASDEDTSHLFGDTAVPAGRTERFFIAEVSPKPTQEESAETTPARAIRLLRQASQAEAVSTASNARWKAENPGAEPGKIQLSEVKVKLGDEVLFEEEHYMRLIRGKRVGLITNPSGVDSRLVATVDKLANSPDCKLTALFAPEHGVRGAQAAGEKVKDGKDPVTGVQVYSLHGTDARKRPQNKPRKSMLENVDVLVYDIQDIGNRSYTYIGTMKLCMQAAKENGKEFVVLDRPNPMGGELVSGNVLDPDFKTLVGTAPLAYLYGLTCGETALWFNEHEGIHCKLSVVPMKGWKRSMKWWDTGLPWIPTSTHMQHVQECWHIAITGTLGELNAVNEGVGFPAPFEYVGAPWIDSVRFAGELNGRGLPGVFFRPVYYRPYYHVFKDRDCGGIQVVITDYDKVMPVETGMHIIEAIQKIYPEQKILMAGVDADTTKTRERVSMFNKVMGTDKVRAALLEGKSAAEISKSWVAERERFARERRKYFLYK
jgi:uncharacterized protein YbbC (DUF1343 family)